MSLARWRNTSNSHSVAQVPSNTAQSEHDHQIKPTELDEFSPPMRAIILQFSVLLLALALLYIRKSETIILGYRLRLIWGVVPAECLLLSLLIGEMSVREVGQLGSEVIE